MQDQIILIEKLTKIENLENRDRIINILMDTLNIVNEFEKAAYVVVFHQQLINIKSTE